MAWGTAITTVSLVSMIKAIRDLPERRREPAEGLALLAGIVALMWIVEALNALDGDGLDRAGGIIPRDFDRLWAIFTAPFLHANFYPHLVDNTIPLVFMGVFIALRGAARLLLVTVIVIVIGGLGTWLISPGHTETVGASGIVFGYATYLFARGVFDRTGGARDRRAGRGRVGRRADLQPCTAPAHLLAGPRRGSRRRDRRRVVAGRPQSGQGRSRRPAQDAARLAGSRAGSVASSAVRIFSGIQPTGRKHLGNYIGAITQYVAGQDRGEAIYCVVDLHATTVPYEPAGLRESVYDTAAILLAAGLDPERCIFFRQSDVLEQPELCWLLQSVTSFGELNRMTQFKDKAGSQRDLVSAGLFTYPVLMAADVLAYRAHEVPVGDDQRQHLELMRNIAERFNARFGDTLVVPEARIPTVGARIMDLQAPERKMSTTGGSVQGTVYVLDEPATIVKKVRSSVTDSASGVHRAPDKLGISNLIDILAAVRSIAPEEVEREFSGSGYGAFKQAVADAVVDYLAPVRERYEALRSDEPELDRILAGGAVKARAIAADTLVDVRAAMGFGPVRPGG